MGCGLSGLQSNMPKAVPEDTEGVLGDAVGADAEDGLLHVVVGLLEGGRPCQGPLDGVQQVLLQQGCAEIRARVVMGICTEGRRAWGTPARKAVQHINGTHPAKGAEWARQPPHLSMQEARSQNATAIQHV